MSQLINIIKGIEWLKYYSELWAYSKHVTLDSHSCADQGSSLHMIYLLSATGLTPSGSSTVHKQYTEQHNNILLPLELV
jgi:hypothetical protein